MKTLMITSNDYIPHTYVGTYVEEIISVKYDRCDVQCDCNGCPYQLQHAEQNTLSPRWSIIK